MVALWAGEQEPGQGDLALEAVPAFCHALCFGEERDTALAIAHSKGVCGLVEADASVVILQEAGEVAEGIFGVVDAQVDIVVPAVIASLHDEGCGLFAGDLAAGFLSGDDGCEQALGEGICCGAEGRGHSRQDVGRQLVAHRDEVGAGEGAGKAFLILPGGAETGLDIDSGVSHTYIVGSHCDAPFLCGRIVGRDREGGVDVLPCEQGGKVLAVGR